LSGCRWRTPLAPPGGARKSVELKKVMSSGLVSTRDFQVGIKQAWHGQTRIAETLTAADFPDIVRAPLSYVTADGESRAWPGMFVPVSADDGLPVGTASGESYTIFSPKEAMEYLQEVLSGTEYKIESLGMIFDRSRWFVTFDLTELAGICPAGEAFKLGASGGLDKSFSPMVGLSHLTQVCANTVALARAGRALFSSKLTKGFGARLEASRAAVGQVVGMARIFNESLRSLEAKPATVDEARNAYAADLSANGADLRSSRASNLVDELIVGFRHGRGNGGATRLDVLNGFTEVFGSGLVGAASKRDAFSRWQSSEFGGFADRKESFAAALTEKGGWDRMQKEGNAALAEARAGALAVN